MPNQRIENASFGADLGVQRFRVKATGEVGTAVSPNGSPKIVTRMVTIGEKWNENVVDLFFEETGEIRTWRADFLERIDADNQ